MMQFKFLKKMKFIACLIFHRIGQEILFDNMLGKKQAFLDFKKVILKDCKNWHFCKGILLENFKFLGCVFFYWTCLYIVFDKILEKKTSFSRVKKRPSPKVEKWVNPWFWSKKGHVSNFFF